MVCKIRPFAHPTWLFIFNKAIINFRNRTINRWGKFMSKNSRPSRLHQISYVVAFIFGADFGYTFGREYGLILAVILAIVGAVLTSTLVGIVAVKVFGYKL